MAPKINIIIPIYNVERYLVRCLDSVLAQTFSDWSAILVDDGSPDNSGKIAEEYAARDQRFVVVHKKNGGLASARNAGLKRATGKYIMFLDSDDCIHPQTMEFLYGIAEKENVDIVSFEYDRDSHDDKDAVNFPPDKIPEYFKNRFDLNKIRYKRVENLIRRATNSDLGARAWYVQMCMVTMRMYRADFLNDLMFDESISVLEDIVFWSLVLLKRPNGLITHLPLYYYTVNAGSILHSKHGFRATVDIIRGMNQVAHEYKLHANSRDMRIWYKRFFWSIMARVLRGVMRDTDIEQKQEIAKLFQEMKQNKIFDVAPDFHARRYRRRMFKFISQNLGDK